MEFTESDRGRPGRAAGEGRPPDRFRDWLRALPYAGSPEGDRAEARLVLKAGSALASSGALLFLAGWGRGRGHPTAWLLDAAFVVVLLGWILLLVGGAFWFVLALARLGSRRRP